MSAESTTDVTGRSPSSGLDFPVIGLGASAGGLAALTKCFENLPATPDMAFVVIMHLSPTHESNAAAILQRATRMPVSQVKGPTRIERDQVYVVPPTHGLSMYDGHLSLVPTEKDRGRPIAIDQFFRTLAEAHRERAVGIVLSGTGSDGSIGLARIKEEGGVVIAQSPDDAEYAGMPQSAIATGKVDIVLPAADIPQKLIDLWQNAKNIELPDAGGPDLAVLPPSSPRAAEEALQEIMKALHAGTGHDFRHYKRATVLRRVERRLQVNSVRTLPEYVTLLKAHPAETKALLSDMLIGVTNFFRDRESFEALERDILPRLFDSSFAGEQLRAWVAGCSTGEEAYSLAIVLSDELTRAEEVRAIQVFASDIDEPSLSTARAGLYPEAIVTDVPPNFLRTYFNKLSNGYQVNEAVRKRVLFAVQNMLRDPPFSRLDLITCRNVLIYLNREAQAEVLRMFHFALRPGGYLFLGGSETADAFPALFEPVDRKHRIYRALPGSRAPTVMRPLPMGEGWRPQKPQLGSAVEGVKPPAFGDIHQRLAFEQPGRGSVLVNRSLEILHLSPGAGQFLRLSEGDMPRQLLEVVDPELRLELRAVLFEMPNSPTGAASRPIRLVKDGQAYLVWMEARPSQRAEWPPDLILVAFDQKPADALDPAGAASAGPADRAVAQLEQELQRKDKQLQSSIEQFGTSAEDLKSSNEELQAMNEELRSASEELETSKEELQSTNEELSTVNVELKSKVEETSQVNDDLQNLMRATEIATIFIDRQMLIKRFTPATRSLFNLIEADVGRSLLDLTHKLEYDALAADAETTFQMLRMVEREVRSSDGRWFLARFLPYRTGEDRIDGAVLTFIDISSRVLAESKMNLGEERMQLVAASIPDFAMLTTDIAGKITSWSKGAESLYGFSETEALGKLLDIIYTPEDLAAGYPAKELREAADSGKASVDRWHVRKDGSRLFASCVVAKLTLGNLQGFAKIAHDATARHLRESEGAAAMQAARDSERLKDEFLAVMSHELKHPLNLIHVNAQLLLNLPETKSIPSVRRAGETIERSVSAQTRIIDDLLELSRAKSGKLRLDLAPLDLGQAIEPTLMWAAERCKSKGLEFGSRLSPEPLIVLADIVRVEQMVMNLIDNAIKFTASGGRINVTLLQEEGAAVLEVADSGRGISAEFLPHVFGMFEQEERGSARREGGLGIGLGLARQIVTMHEGRIEVRSPGTGRGSTFTLRLPLHRRSDFAPLEAAQESLQPLDRLRILLVDDDADGVETFALLLHTKGAQVASAKSGAEALRLCEDVTFDLIISDIGMPNMDGSELIAKLRRRPQTALVPAIALTGYGRPQDIQAALDAGFTAHLVKPVDLQRLGRLATELVKREP